MPQCAANLGLLDNELAFLDPLAATAGLGWRHAGDLWKVGAAHLVRANA